MRVLHLSTNFFNAPMDGGQLRTWHLARLAAMNHEVFVLGMHLPGNPPTEEALRSTREQIGCAAVVVPNGTLSGDGVCARIKEQLLTEFNPDTIVRLPNGVFAPYTSIPTNLLFFDRSGPTREVWYYEHPLPEGRKNYTKTMPIQFEEFRACLDWWNKREASDNAWKIPAKELLSSGCNLDRKNPSAKDDFEHLPPERLAQDIFKKEQRIAEIVGHIRQLLAKGAKS